MASPDRQETAARNYNTISPSARSLLLMKGLTNIPFARKAAELIVAPNQYQPDFNNRDVGFWARVIHFEMRYWSIDQLLDGLPIKNILELSSGFSFRGLEKTRDEEIHYIDTDLPDVVAAKRNIIQSLELKDGGRHGKLELIPLNALDEKQFFEVVERFPPGEIVIINEGLLMYLQGEEKKKLCSIIHKVLQDRGGYWITADIYLAKKTTGLDITVSKEEKEFSAQHRIEENKFDSMEAARKFFQDAGFAVEKEAETDRSKLTSLEYLLKSASIFQLLKFRKRGKIQATWRLRPVHAAPVD
ncbi:MAG TPA: hypothetical protein VMM58_07775 [Bacteroidota bacterium]|nr:hypothetical protein [Bacteroidota bacterium]